MIVLIILIANFHAGGHFNRGFLLVLVHWDVTQYVLTTEG